MIAGKHGATDFDYDPKSLRVLLAVSCPSTARQLVALLNEIVGGGIRLCCADRLSVAMQRLHHQLFDVALLDPSLPDARGLDPVSMLLEQQPTMPVLVVASSETGALTHNALHPGAMAYLAGNDLDLDTLRSCLIAAACLEPRQSSRIGVDNV